LQERFNLGFAYSDCCVEDSRLVVLNAVDARERGALIAVRTALVSATRGADSWAATLEDTSTHRQYIVRARVIVNAAGPWVADVLKTKLGVETTKHVRLIKGSHIITRRLYDGEHAYILQNADQRIVFAIPYEGEFTLIGTTDLPYEEEPHCVSITAEETRYLCDSINHCLRGTITPGDVVWSYAGVRPLFDDGSIKASVVTRDYVFDLDTPPGLAPALSIFGGKITTFRRLAEHAMSELRPFFPALKPAWTERAKLPGGDIANEDFDVFVHDVRRRKPFLDPKVTRRLARSYGTRLERFTADAKTMADLGRDFGMGLTEAEIDYLRQTEWAVTADDILWRRSKLGLHLPAQAATDLAAYLAREQVGLANSSPH
jgi:glycerol-3-phosphate dehydrogenase